MRTRADLVTEAAVGVLALLDVVDALFAHVVGHVNARVASGPQPHDVADRDRQVGIALLRRIAPAASIVLALAGELDRGAQLVTDGRVEIAPVRHAVDLREEQGRKAVAVHVVLAEVRLRNVAGFLYALGDELDASIDLLAERPLSGRTATAHKRQAGKAAHGDTPLITAVAKRPLIGPRKHLPLAQPGKAAVNGLLGLGRDHLGGSASVA